MVHKRKFLLSAVESIAEGREGLHLTLLCPAFCQAAQQGHRQCPSKPTTIFAVSVAIPMLPRRPVHREGSKGTPVERWQTHRDSRLSVDEPIKADGAGVYWQQPFGNWSVRAAEGRGGGLGLRAPDRGVQLQGPWKISALQRVGLIPNIERWTGRALWTLNLAYQIAIRSDLSNKQKL